MKKTANELLDSMQDNRFSETEFLKFVENLKTNQYSTNHNKAASNDSSEQLIDNLNEDEKLWANAMNNVQKIDSEANKWAEEFQVSNLSNELSNSKASTFWDDLNEEWNTSAK